MHRMYTGRQLREVFHFCFLERLLRIADPGLFVLKGGVNLRFFFHSPRYSEDMDLDVLGGGVGTLKKNGYKLLEDTAFRRTLRTYGITDIEINDPDKAKHTETTQRFRVRLTGPGGEKLPGKVEFSRRVAEPASARTLEAIDGEIARQYNRLGFKCQHYHGQAAVVQKILALAGRAVTQARDVFDLDILHRAGHTADLQLREKISPEQRAAALQNLDALTFDDYAGQVVEFLEDEYRKEYGSRQAWQAMAGEVRKLLDPA
jgi:hypothetical protein